MELKVPEWGGTCLILRKGLQEGVVSMAGVDIYTKFGKSKKQPFVYF